MEVITLLTDFSTKSESVGIMKCVIHSICPTAKVIDIFHDIESFNVMQASSILESRLPYLPKGIHVAIVDPGVGSGRRAIAVKLKRGDILIGPDNGLLAPCLKRYGTEQVISITNTKYRLDPLSGVFHGRDIFAPCAAHLASGVPLVALGEQIAVSSLVPPPYTPAKKHGSKITGTAVSTDHFGNIHTTIPTTMLGKNQHWTIKIKTTKIKVQFAQTFSSVPHHKPLLCDDAYGSVMLSINQGNFKEKYGLKLGDEIILKSE